MESPREFLPFLNNWMLLFVVIAFGYYWAKINFIDPKLKQLHKQEAFEDLPNGHVAKKKC